ncbi:phosphoesterase, partial [Thermococci archaeon]
MKYKKWPEIIKQVLKVSFGARFYRCAFQVNPYDYVKRHRKNFSFNLEEKYNYAIVKALKEKGIEVIAVTDHYRIHTSLSLIEKARDAGIFVFPGFEAVTKEGIHVLCLFEQDTPLQTIERFIGACGVHDEGEDSPLGNITFEELLFKVQKEWKGICIAAHILEKGGLLTALKGTARVKCWKNPELLAVALATYPEDQNIPQEYREILLNRKAEYKRERPPAFINAQDICSPEDVKKNNTWCWIKMSEVSIEALRQAFLDPGSRVRLANEEIPSEHAYLVAIAWEGGFLDSQVIHFNSDLNVLVGGRGTGKSTIIESIRYALGLKPLTEDVQKIHKGIIQNVLKPGTRIWLVIRTFSPEVKDYLIERSIPNPPIVRNEEGEVLDVLPEELISGIEIFGQQELADLSRYPQRVRALLERFFPEEMKSLQRRIKELKRRLEASRREIISLIQEKESLEEELSRLPLIEEKIQQLKGSEVEKALYEHRMILREKSILKEIKENLKEIMLIFEPVKQKLDFEVKTLLPKEPHPEEGLKYLQKAVSLCERLKNRLCYFLYEMEAEGEHTLEVMEELIKNWHTEREILTIEKLRKIEKKLSLKLDSKEITRWYREYETLKPKQTRLELLKKRLETLYEERKKMLLEWEEIIFEECQLYKKVIKKINRKLENRVRVKVVCGGDREELINFLKQNTKGLRGD